MRWFPIRIRINLKRALFSIRNRWIPSPAENNDRAQISSGCWNDGCTKGSESGCVQGFGARLTKKIGKCVLAKEKAVDSNESTAFILVEVTGLEPAASWSQTTRATNCATPRSYSLPIIIHEGCRRQAPTAVGCGAYGKYHARRRRSPRINRWVG